jgi:rhodanese-related sulfurtransferase
MSSNLLSKIIKMFWWLPFGRVPEISAFELHEHLDSDKPPQILDVRTKLEWERSHIAGSINVPIHQLRGRLPSLGLVPDRPVVAICLTAHRSIPAVRLLQSHGFEEVVQLAGGMTAWWRGNLPTG